MSKYISKKIYKDRINTCLSCPYYDDKFHRCKDCGCFLLLKAALTFTKCPQSKWEQ